MVVLIMGVAGAGKTTVGRLLASETGFRFVDADDYHSPENKAKMAAGVPLTDTDREPWLEALAIFIRESLLKRVNVVLACSALKAAYRARLVVSSEVKLVHLSGPVELTRGRLLRRPNHYMHADLAESQYEALEPPASALVLDAALAPKEIVRRIRQSLEI